MAQEGRLHAVPSDAKISASLDTGAENQIAGRVWGEVQKHSFISLPGKGGHRGLLPQETKCPKPGGCDEEFYSNTSRVGLPRRIRVCAGSQVVGLLILMSFSGPCNLALGGFLAALPLISNCLNLPFGTQARSWRLESCLRETGDKKASVPGSPTGSPLGFISGLLTPWLLPSFRFFCTCSIHFLFPDRLADTGEGLLGPSVLTQLKPEIRAHPENPAL